MNSFVTYSIELAASLTIFYLIFRVFLSKENHFALVRMYFVSTVIVALTLPTLNITYKNIKSENSVPQKVISKLHIYKKQFSTKLQQFNNFDNSQQTEQIQLTETVRHEKNQNFNLAKPVNIIFSKANILLSIKWIYLVGVLFLLIRFLFNIFQIIRYIFIGRVEKSGNTRIVILQKSIAPFSFFNFIFISKDQYEKPELSTILQHENIHILQKHSFDNILFELVFIIQWFNPFVYFMKKAAKRNHEYLADAGVIKSGFGIQQYQYCLLNSLLQNHKIEIASPYALRDINLRVAMLSKPKPQKIYILKFLILIPVIALLFCTISLNFQYDLNNFNSASKLNFLENFIFEFQNLRKDFVSNHLPKSVEIPIISGRNLKNKTAKPIYLQHKNNQEVIIDNCDNELDISQLKSIHNLVCNMRDSVPFTGKCYSHHESGELGMTGFYENGKESGTWIYWYKNGTKKMEYCTFNGLKNGTYKAWYKNGNLRIDTHYNQGEIDELYQCWHENGVLKKEACFSFGAPVESNEFDENGIPHISL